MKIALFGPELEENLALRYLQASLEKAGHHCRIFDFHCSEQIDSLSDDLLSFSPQLVGLSMVFTARAREYILLSDTLRHKQYRGHITAGGHFASFHAEQLLSSFDSLDTIIHGEGEESLVTLAANLDRPHHVENISYRNRDGRVCHTHRKPNNPHLDALPRPTRTHSLPRILNLPIANMLAGRGCFANCNFCSIAAWHKQNGGPRFRFRSPDQVAAEMAYLYHEYGVRIFNFHDDNFFNPQHQDSISRFQAIKKHLKKEGIDRIGIQVKARPDSISHPVVAALKDIGLFRVFLGVENNAVAGLHALGRGTTKARNYHALDILRHHDVHTTFNLLMFEPNMTADDYKDNVHIMHTHSSFPLNFGRVEVYGGTPLEAQLRMENRLLGNYFGYTYRIKDPAMQTAFEIFNRVFTERNFDPRGMSLMAMQLDYYFHLLKHFYPQSATLTLRHEVKGCVEKLNRNNASLMTAIHHFVTKETNRSSDDILYFTNHLLQQREAYDDNARPVFTALIEKMEQTAVASQAGKSRMFPGLSAAAAAVLVVCSVHCDNPTGTDRHNDKATIIPSDSTEWEAAPMLLQYQASEVSRRIRGTYHDDLRTLAEQYDYYDKPIDIDLMLDTGGVVAASRVEVPDSVYSKAFRDDLTSRISDWTFSNVNGRGRCIVNITVMNVAYPEHSIETDTIQWHIYEYIATPFDTSKAEPDTLSFSNIVWNAPLWQGYNAFDSSILSEIESHIDSTYLETFKQYYTAQVTDEPMDINIDMILDAFGNVTMFRIRKEDEPLDDQLDSALRELVACWRFPFIKTMVARSGKCTVGLNE